jgi:hypothetical protein
MSGLAQRADRFRALRAQSAPGRALIAFKALVR